LSQFSRRARWLNSLFPASVTPQIQDPGVVSEDVSLVQSYDAGGQGFASLTFPGPEATAGVLVEITNPENSIRDINTVIGATSSTDLFHIADDLVCRLYAVSWIRLAGTMGSVFHLKARAKTGTGVSEHDVMISENVDATVLPNSRHVLPLIVPVLMPGTQVQAQFNTGDSSAQIRLTFMMCVAPLGTIFTI